MGSLVLRPAGSPPPRPSTVRGYIPTLVLRPAGSPPPRPAGLAAYPGVLERSGRPDAPRRALRAEQAIIDTGISNVLCALMQKLYFPGFSHERIGHYFPIPQ